MNVRERDTVAGPAGEALAIQRALCSLRSLSRLHFANSDGYGLKKESKGFQIVPPAFFAGHLMGWGQSLETLGYTPQGEKAGMRGGRYMSSNKY